MTTVAVPRRSLNRDAVVRAAAELVDSEGVAALTLTRLADTLGVSQPALYNHVRSVSDCSCALALHGRRLLSARLRRAAAGRSGDVAVHAVADAWRGFARRHTGVYATIGRHRANEAPELAAAAAEVRSLLHDVVLSYPAAGGHVELGVCALHSGLHGFVALEAEGIHGTPASADAAFRALVDLICDGLRAVPPRSFTND